MDITLVNEIVNDAFWLSYILEIKRKITDFNQKELLTNFLIFFSSIFCDETLLSGIGGINKESKVTKKNLSYFRNHNLKACSKSHSKDTKSIVSEMGIDFDHYTFDIVLTLADSKIVDINFRNWKTIKEENSDLLEMIVYSPNAWMEKLLPDIYQQLIQKLGAFSEMIIKKISEFKIDHKPFSTNRMFIHSKLGADDKLYILQRYGLVKLVWIIDSLFHEASYLSIEINGMKLDFKKFITKCKAVVLEMLWNDKKQNEGITIINDIISKNNILIPSQFFEMNRRIRNNLHYGEHKNITEEEMNFVRDFQDIYIKNAISTFDNQINTNFGFGYKAALTIAKIQWWASH